MKSVPRAIATGFQRSTPLMIAKRGPGVATLPVLTSYRTKQLNPNYDYETV